MTEDLFRGRWALITGASSGLGEEFAKQLARMGCHLVLTSRSRERLLVLGAQLGEAHSVQCRVIDADLASEAGMASLLEQLDSLGVEIDHVIANAGFGAWGPFDEAELESQTQMVRVNCESLVALVHRTLAPMIARRFGGVILVASTASFQPIPRFAVYAATKAFVRSFGEALAEETRSKGVHVSVLCPGPVPTGFQARAGTHITRMQRASVWSSEQTVEHALREYAAKRGVIVPGVANQLGAILGSYVPRRVMLPLLRQMMRSRG
jgi:short-subunit dehydrogenase